MDINIICQQFLLFEKIIDIKQVESGNINKSYKISTENNCYLLQKINKQVFKYPRKIIKNATQVINHLQSKKLFDKCLKLIKTRDDCNYYIDNNGDFWRCYEFISNSVSFNESNDLNIIYETGRAFGKFQSSFVDYDISSLYVTIENFHNTEKRFLDLFESATLAGERLTIAKKEYEYLQSIYNRITVFNDLQRLGALPLRITHNDTKCNNVLFDEQTKKAVCVVDLDTVMPGIVAYDFGDGARSIASSVSEEEKNLDIVQFDLEKFKSFTLGFLSECKDILTNTEKKTLYLSVFVITAELSARFLTDYFIRDKYFKISYPTNNLVRAKNQIKLLKDIDKKLPYIKKIIEDCLA